MTSKTVSALHRPLRYSTLRSTLSVSGSARPSRSEISAIGTAATNTQRQSKLATSQPPSVGASAEDEATTTELMPIPLPRLRAG